jgi:catechol 2,3-dioxygenase-like lactoylglutathione lyase family enzyme
MQIAFVTGFAPIVADPQASRAFYDGSLGLKFEGGSPEYPFTDHLGGVKHFGLWPLSQVAESCFGTKEWPVHLQTPQASMEFEVATVEAVAEAEAELRAKGHTLLHATRTEPWNQTITRLLSPEGLLIGVCYTPWFH